MRDLNSNYLDIIDQFSSKKILVIGDFILDTYVKGISTRLSPEAPVPVVDVGEKKQVLGGAANTACNVKALGADVTFCSVIGEDPSGELALNILKASGIDTSYILTTVERSTIVKTRVLAGGRVLLRYDEGTETTINDDLERRLTRLLGKELATFDAIIISDYNKGVIKESLVLHLQQFQATRSKFLAVDSKRLSFFSTLNPSLVKPNYEEAIKLLKVPGHYDRIEQINSLQDQLFEQTQAAIVAVTLDTEGSLIFERGNPCHRAYAADIASPNVSGAGDTYISAFTLAYLCANNIAVAGDIATIASTITIGKSETAACYAQELKCHIGLQQKFVLSQNNLKQLCAIYREQGKRIVFTNGCFDILHSGHVSYLNEARALGDILIVGVNNDESIRRLKGEKRPINPLEDRLQVLAGLTAVNHVFPFGEINDDTPIELITAVRPEVFVKGGDYTKDQLPEAGILEEVGSEIVFIPLVPHHSTTRIIGRINPDYATPALV